MTPFELDAYQVLDERFYGIRGDVGVEKLYPRGQSRQPHSGVQRTGRLAAVGCDVLAVNDAFSFDGLRLDLVVLDHPGG